MAVDAYWEGSILKGEDSDCRENPGRSFIVLKLISFPYIVR